jgi:protein-tyrosine kinase
MEAERADTIAAGADVSIVENLLANLNNAKKASAHARAPAQVPAAAPHIALPEPAKRIEIDQLRLRVQGYLPEIGQERRFADFCREVKRPLVRKAFAPDAPAERRLVMVSSALPGEGKTFVTLNLALSLARERDISTLLVDADLPKAHISRALDLGDEPGLVDALVDEKCDIESLVVGTDIPGLTILPAGRPSEQVAELVSSARMAQIAAALVARSPRRLVLCDSPPLLASSEARALMHIPGLVLLVARAGYTPRQALIDALAHVEKHRVHGVIVNEARAGSQDANGPYGYYGYPTRAAAEPAGSDPAA